MKGIANYFSINMAGKLIGLVIISAIVLSILWGLGRCFEPKSILVLLVASIPICVIALATGVWPTETYVKGDSIDE